MIFLLASTAWCWTTFPQQVLSEQFTITTDEHTRVDAAANGTAAPLSELTAEEPRVIGASTEHSCVTNEAFSGRRSRHC
jgi:hypothetical protein